MEIVHKLTMYLDQRRLVPCVDVVQCDANTRVLELTLLSGGEAWEVPSGMGVAVAFRKSDGTAGLYDVLPDGTKACSYSGNVVRAVLAPQVLTAWGKVEVAVVIQDSSTLDRVATFPVHVEVARDPSAGKGISNDYYRCTSLGDVNEILDGFDQELEEFRDSVRPYAWTVTPSNMEVYGWDTFLDLPTNRIYRFSYNLPASFGHPTPGKPGTLVMFDASGGDSTWGSVCVYADNTGECYTAYAKSGSVRWKKIGAASTGGGGLSVAAVSALMGVLRNAVYTSDQVEALAELETALYAGSSDDGGGGSSICVITSKLTCVTLLSDTGTTVELGGSYSATLLPDGGYEISSVTVTMGGEDVTADVYADGAIDIPVVSGNIKITASAEVSSKLIHNWDFTKSMVDTVGSIVAIIPNATIHSGNNKAYQDSEGLHLADHSDNAWMQNCFAYGRTYEIQIGDIDPQFGESRHGGLFILEDAEDPNSAHTWAGHSLLDYRAYGGAIGWQAYFGTDVNESGAWNGEIISTDPAAFANKTVKIVVNTDGTFKYYVDGSLVLEPDTVLNWDPVPPHCVLGCYGSSPYNMIIKGFRIYEGVV